MSFHQIRRWHRWVSIVIALPFLVTVVTGIVLATRGFNSWVQPSYPEIKSTLEVSFPDLLKAAQSVPAAEIKTWQDVSQIDIRPSIGNIRIRSKTTQIEIQIDGATGTVTGFGPRRFSWLVALHEGAYFGSFVRYGLFLPSAIGVFFLLCSGVILFFQSYLLKRKRMRIS